jgi:hypothetical protein
MDRDGALYSRHEWETGADATWRRGANGLTWAVRSSCPHPTTSSVSRIGSCQLSDLVLCPNTIDRSIRKHQGLWLALPQSDDRSWRAPGVGWAGMSAAPLQFLLLVFAGWVNRRQREVVEYLQEENRVLREQLGGRSPAVHR